MSTTEYWTSEISNCPCGQGKIVKHVASPDNSYSSGSIRHEIQCSECYGKWGLERKRGELLLVLLESCAEHTALLNKDDSTFKELSQVAAHIVNDYIARLNLKTIKAEWDELKNLGIYTYGSLPRYRNQRKDGRTAGDLASPLSNEGWLLVQSEKLKLKEHLLALMERHQNLKLEISVAASKIVRRPLPGKL